MLFQRISMQQRVQYKSQKINFLAFFLIDVYLFNYYALRGRYKQLSKIKIMKTHSKFMQSTFSKSKLVLGALLIALSFACSPEDGADGTQGIQGESGQQGEQGPQGEAGNANVSKYTITIADSDWNNGVHGGDDNTFNFYVVPEALTGGISISNSNYVVIAYGKPDGANYDYSYDKPLPYTFGVENSFGLKFELSSGRSRVMMSKTTNGWDNSTVPLAERPNSFRLELFMIEINAARIAQNEIDFNNYNEVVEYFELAN